MAVEWKDKEFGITVEKNDTGYIIQTSDATPTRFRSPPYVVKPAHVYTILENAINDANELVKHCRNFRRFITSKN